MKYTFFLIFSFFWIPIESKAVDPASLILSQAFSKLSQAEKQRVIQGLQSFFSRADLLTKKENKSVWIKNFLRSFEAYAQVNNKCIYGGFYSTTITNNVCTHPLNLDQNHPDRKYYEESCRKSYEREDLCKDTNYNSCNPLLFGEKRDTPIPNAGYDSSGFKLSEYTTFMCYYQSKSNPNLHINNMGQLLVELSEPSKLKDFIRLVQDGLEICLCNSSSNNIDPQYVSKIHGTSTCEALLLQLLDLLKLYLEVRDMEGCNFNDDSYEEFEQIFRFLDAYSPLLEKGERVLFNLIKNETSIENVGDKIKKVHQSYQENLQNRETFLADEIKKNTNFCENVPGLEIKYKPLDKLPTKFDEIGNKTSIENEEKKECQFGLKVEKDCSAPESCTLIPTLKVCGNDKVDNYNLKFVVSTDVLKEEEEGEENEEESFFSKIPGMIGTILGVASKISDSAKDTTSGATLTFDKKESEYTVSFLAIKDNKIEATVNESIDPLEAEVKDDDEACDPTDVKLIATNTCDTDNVVTISCTVSVDFELPCEVDQVEIIESKITWQLPEDLNALGDKPKSGTIDAGGSKKFYKVAAPYAVAFEGKVKVKESTKSETSEVEANASTTIPMFNSAYRQQNISNDKK